MKQPGRIGVEARVSTTAVRSAASRVQVQVQGAGNAD